MPIISLLLWALWQPLRWFLRQTGRAVTVLVIAIITVVIAFGLKSGANYLATLPASGSTFASIDIAAVKHTAFVLCDSIVGVPQCAAVKAASTAPAATDQALVTSLSPNSAGLLPTGQAVMANSAPVVIASDQSAISVTTSGTQTVQGTTAAGSGAATNLVTVQGNASGTAIPTTVSGTVATTSAPSTSGGLSLYFVQPTASDNHANIKNGAGQVYKISITNNSATINYVRLYNAGTGFNGCNSATNIVYENAIPASSTTSGALLDFYPNGIAFATGISICVTSGYAQTDTTNATASAMNVNIGYK